MTDDAPILIWVDGSNVELPGGETIAATDEDAAEQMAEDIAAAIREHSNSDADTMKA